jgi:hypothetical protein
MKKIILLLAMGLALLYFQSASSMEAKKLKGYGRAKIIKLAVEKIRFRSPSFDQYYFDKVSVLAGKKTVLVRFEAKYDYIPKYSAYYNKVDALLAPDEEITMGTIKNPDDYPNAGDPQFPRISAEANRAIKIVKQATKDKPKKFAGKTLIYDRDTYYEVVVDKKQSTLIFKVDKKTSAISEERRGYKPVLSIPEYGEKLTELKR